MKILHVADTHLGYSAYRKITEEGVNQREIDVFNAFQQFIDYALKIKPDLILHSGDLFDSVRPNNRAITFALKQILRISKQNIPIVIIAGNHEHPKLKETGHIFSIFDHIDNVFPIYNEKYERIPFTINSKEIMIHAISQCISKDDFNVNLKKLKPDQSSDYNIFMAHGAVKGIKEFSMNEFNELFIPAKLLESDFDFIALGHYHKYSKITNNAYYSGSTENLTFADAGEKKGFIELDFNDSLKHRFIPLKTRPMIQPELIKCNNLNIDQVMKKIKEKITEIQPKGKIFRVILKDISSIVYRNIDFKEIRKLCNEAVHFEIKTDTIDDEQSTLFNESKIDSLSNEFVKFLKNQKVDDKEKILKLGMEYIQKIESREEAT